MKYPKITVITITYGHENYIIDTIKSVLSQKYDGEIEFIIANDNSPDDTDQIVNDFFKNNTIPSNFIIDYIKHDVNKGIIDNSMWTFKQATGKYIAICEGDDYWTDSNKLQKQIDFLETNIDYSLHVHNAVVKYDDSQRKEHFFNSLKESKELYINDIVFDWIIPTASMVFKREVIDDLPTWFSSIYSGDLTLSLLSINKGRVYFSNEIMSVYRVTFNGSSASSIYKDKMEFVYSQHLKLFTYFNEFSNFKYNTTIVKKIVSLRKEIEFLKIFKHSKVAAGFRFPQLFVSKFFKKISNF